MELGRGRHLRTTLEQRLQITEDPQPAAVRARTLLIARPTHRAHAHVDQPLMGMAAILPAWPKLELVAQSVAEALRPLRLRDRVPDRLWCRLDEDAIHLRGVRRGTARVQRRRARHADWSSS